MRARADEFDALCDTLEDIGELLRQSSAEEWPIDYVELMPQKDVGIRAYIFLRKEDDLVTCEKSGALRAMGDFLHARLAEAGLGARNETKLAIEFDSKENVDQNFKGSYLLRMS